MNDNNPPQMEYLQELRIVVSRQNDVLVIICKDQTFANRAYMEFGENLTISMSELKGGDIGFKLYFTDKHTQIERIIKKDDYQEYNLNRATLVKYWTCGYHYANDVHWIEPTRHVSSRQAF